MSECRVRVFGAVWLAVTIGATAGLAALQSSGSGDAQAAYLRGLIA